MLWTFTYKSLCGHILSFLLGKYQRVEWLDPMGAVCLTVWEVACFPKNLHHLVLVSSPTCWCIPSVSLGICRTSLFRWLGWLIPYLLREDNSKVPGSHFRANQSHYTHCSKKRKGLFFKLKRSSSRRPDTFSLQFYYFLLPVTDAFSSINEKIRIILINMLIGSKFWWSYFQSTWKQFVFLFVCTIN